MVDCNRKIPTQNLIFLNFPNNIIFRAINFASRNKYLAIFLTMHDSATLDLNSVAQNMLLLTVK